MTTATAPPESFILLWVAIALCLWGVGLLFAAAVWYLVP